ncbi:unnamed protein product [Brachionus calyciflorus]|uniref:Uncharacterized protein n=1 Tax=Brachionus calyciflorus TaxID=104777 RepID=A0A813M3F4_9BILA|nr:unnamed protein product [Brachionus calyciflorus]
MSDEEEDYSSDDSSVNEEVAKKKNSGPGQLTLEDNDDDSNAFQRPDMMFEINGEDDDEFAGEEEDSMDYRKNRANKSLNKTSSTISRNDLDDKKKKKKKKNIGICVTATKYECVRRVARKLGFKEVEENEDWSLFWTDCSVSIDRVNQMKKWQKINHFPGMSEICRKDFLTRNMNRMAKLYPKDYSFYPKAWCMPADYADFINYARLKKNKTYICKPDSGCQGRGIFITKNPNKDIKPGDNYVAQVYVSRPFTVDGFKFDLRVYVAVTSCDPFRIFVYKEGLARFTTLQYEEPTQNNCKDVFMHLTNYAIQKKSEEFIRDEETGTKRRISTINKWLKANGYDVDKLWDDIDDVIIKVLLSAHAVLKHNYRTCFANHFRGSACFEILGYDILIDKKLKPYVLEVNHSPSFTTDSKLDREIKDALIYDTIMLMNIGALDKKKCVDEERKRVRERLFLKQGKKETKEELDEVQQDWLKQIEKWEDKHIGNFRRIYPGPGTEKYDKFYNTTGTLFSETAASRARLEQAKQQMEEISRKNEKFMVNKNKIQNKEVRGESPGRKTSTNNTSIQKNSIASVSSNQSKVPSQQKSQMSRNSSSTVMLNTIGSIATNGQNTNSSLTGIMSKHQVLIPPSQAIPSDSLKPNEINDLDEMERLQSLKQRENLLRGMGIVDFVNRILFGTSGTVATIPPNFYPNTNPNEDNNYTKNVTQGNKLEIRTKNYNPFDNQSLFAEKYINNQRKNKTNQSSSNSNQSRSKYGNNNSHAQISDNNSLLNGNYRYQFSVLSGETDSGAYSRNNGLNGSKLNGRYPNEFFTKNDANPSMVINNMQNQFNNFRVKSAQNLNKQRVSDKSLTKPSNTLYSNI